MGSSPVAGPHGPPEPALTLVERVGRRRRWFAGGGPAASPARSEELLALLDESGSDELVRQVRAAEAVDPDGRQWPRTKRSDDATAVYLVINGSTTGR
jgi:hypothetical protein